MPPFRDDIRQDDSFEAIGAELSVARIAKGMQIAVTSWTDHMKGILAGKLIPA